MPNKPRRRRIDPARVRFILNDKTKSETLLLLTIRINKKRITWSTGEKISPKDFSTKTRRAIIRARTTDLRSLNKRLNEYERIALDLYHEWGLDDPVKSIDFDQRSYKLELDYRTGKRVRPKKKGEASTLTEFAAMYVAERRKEASSKRGTWKVLNTVANYLAEFTETQRRPLTFSDIDHNFAHRFKNWMFAEPREFSTNYAAKVFSVVRQFMREAQRRKLHSNGAYEEFTIKKVKVTHIALSFDELKLLEALDLSKNERLEKVRDLFLIGAYTGLRYSDFSRIEPGHFIEEDGEEMLEIVTRKTGEKVVIPLFPVVAELMQKYDYQPPRISSQKMNKYLKELCQIAGLTDRIKVVTSKAGKRIESEVEKWKLVTTHVARRSFATNLYLLGLPAINIMKITGHATERQFMQYIQVEHRRNAKYMAKQIALLTGHRHLRKVN